MATLDWIVLVVYFLMMAVIGVVCWWQVKEQEDYFLGGRSFGKIMQTFAAFGAGTGSNDPVNVGAKTWTSGLAGIWSVLMWLFVTPFYWIFGVWYRRMRHITIGDWYVDRYESKSLGAAYAVFGTYFYMFYLSSMFTAVVKVAIPLIGEETIVGTWGLSSVDDLKYYLIPAMSLLIVVYGVLGGLKAAYWTDLIQGLGIICLSLILIPTGLEAIVDKFEPNTDGGLMRGLELMHERTPAEYFQIFGGPLSSEFPFHYILSLTLLGLLGIVVQPHFISTGGGSAKSESAARVGLVTGNFLKRFCTIGWAMTGLILLTLMADNVQVARDPDMVWGVASREILSGLGFGLVGLMLACLLAAMMSSADCYMIMTSGLFTRNFYKPVRPNASEKEFLLVGRLSGFVMIAGAAVISVVMQDVFKQFVSAVTLPIIFAATFWLGMWWRRANKWSAWITIITIVAVFFVLPAWLPDLMPGLRTDSDFAQSTNMQTLTITRDATATDVAKRSAWEKAKANADAIKDKDKRATALKAIGAAPPVAVIGQKIEDVYKSGGSAVFWAGGLQPVDDLGNELANDPLPEPVSDDTEGNRRMVVQRKSGHYTGKGDFRTELVVYHWLGMDLSQYTKQELKTMELPPKLVTPFLFMILISLVTPRTSKRRLDEYFVKMKVPVDPDSQADAKQLEQAYTDPSKFEQRKIFPGSSIEIQKPRLWDVLGFLICFAVCFGIVWFAVWLTNLGA